MSTRSLFLRQMWDDETVLRANQNKNTIKMAAKMKDVEILVKVEFALCSKEVVMERDIIDLLTQDGIIM